MPQSVLYRGASLELISWSTELLVLHMVHFDSDYEVSYWVCTTVPYSAVAVTVHIRAVCTGALHWKNFPFRVMISFPECSNMI